MAPFVLALMLLPLSALITQERQIPAFSASSFWLKPSSNLRSLITYMSAVILMLQKGDVFPFRLQR